MTEQNLAQRFSNYIRTHRVSLGLFLAAYGAFYLASVILSGWTLADWGKDVPGYPPSTIITLFPRVLINPLFFVTSLPALFVGTLMLCVYCIRGIGSQAGDDREHVAILLAVFGFGYVVVGAWPLGNLTVFPWEWQKTIMSDGAFFAWSLYLLSLVSMVVGAASAFLHSRIYHQKHPELALERITE